MILRNKNSKNSNQVTQKMVLKLLTLCDYNV